jgi:predicted Zn finger-like uncharacterized protein
MSSADSSSLMQSAVLDSSPHAPVGSRFCFCSVCRSAFLFSASQLGSKGNLVRCSICEKEWYQSTDRLQRSDELDYFTFLSEDHVSTVKNTLKENKKTKNTRNKFEVFVGNIPTSWQEKDLLDIFADYGILSVTLSRDSFGQCKGFGFVEFASTEDASLAAKEMNGIYVESNRKISVRLADGRAKGSKISTISPIVS